MGRTSLHVINERIEQREQVPIVVAWNVVEYRKAAERLVVPEDVVLEVTVLIFFDFLEIASQPALHSDHFFISLMIPC